MKNIKEKNKRLYVIIIIGIVLISCALLTILTFYISNYFYDGNNENEVNDKVDNDNNSNENATDDESEVIILKEYTGTFKDNTDSYVLDISGYEHGSAVYYKLSDKLTIKLVFEYVNDEEDRYYRYFNIYINDKYLLEDANYLSDELEFKKVGSNLVYENYGYTDIRSTFVYIINNNFEFTKLYELDKVDGMVPSSVTINSEGVVIEGSRVGHMGVVFGNNRVYKGMDAELSDFGLTGNEIVFATYTYKLNSDGSLDLNPILSDEETLNEFLNSN